MNRSYIEHAVIAALLQLALWPLIGSAWAAGAIAVAVFLGREVAQNEYRVANERGWAWGETMPVAWYEGVWRGWTLKSVFDVLAPLAACALIAALAPHLPRF